jgi:hypothetical protein
MFQLKIPVLWAAGSGIALAGAALDQAEVRISYGELAGLIAKAAGPAQAKPSLSVLQEARFVVSSDNRLPVLEASFNAMNLRDQPATVALADGDFALASRTPADVCLIVDKDRLCLAMEKAGGQEVTLRLLPAAGEDGFALGFPGGAAAVVEAGDLGAGRAARVRIDGREHLIKAGDSVALPLRPCRLEIGLLDETEADEALRPPAPSEWTWQHEVVAVPADGEAIYQLWGRASASGGSGVEAILGLPTEARQVEVAGEDISSSRVQRRDDRSQSLAIVWKSRGVLEREVRISYRLPRRPLERVWDLRAPVGPGATRCRFLIAASPTDSYAADGLAGPFPAASLSQRLAAPLAGAAFYQLEGGAEAGLAVTALPVVETAVATVPEANWSARVEPDGAMWVEGTMTVESQGVAPLQLVVPEGLSLLSCEVGGVQQSPVSPGPGRLEIALPAGGGKTQISCSFTGRADALDPVSGTLALELPRTPLFIRSLAWKIDIPAGYQAETHGNLVRVASQGEGPSRIGLRMNLCRDEAPQTQVFYQRADLKN